MTLQSGTEAHHEEESRIDILLLPGDGIGPEITRAARTVLDALIAQAGLNLRLEEKPIGLAALRDAGTTLPGDVLDAARTAHGIILAPVSTYEYPPRDRGGINPSATIRIELDLYANIRPAWTRAGVASVARSMDLVVVRENTEGFYADRNMVRGSGEFQPTEDIALAVRKITTAGSRRIARAAFELARRRRRAVTAVHKANVLRTTDGLFLRCVHEVATEYPDVTLDEVIVDAMAAALVQSPQAFDVILTTNMFGDILSDEAAALAGGLGLAPALNAGDDHAVAQATHGSAPDIAGRNVANPVALLLSCAMLLEWLAARHGRDDLDSAGRVLRDAVDGVLANPANHTPDLGGEASTSQFAEAVAGAIMRRG